MLLNFGRGCPVYVFAPALAVLPAEIEHRAPAIVRALEYRAFVLSAFASQVDLPRFRFAQREHVPLSTTVTFSNCIRVITVSALKRLFFWVSRKESSGALALRTNPRAIF